MVPLLDDQGQCRVADIAKDRYLQASVTDTVVTSRSTARRSESFARR
jgi:hypothetical protein